MNRRLRILYQHRTQGKGAEGSHIRGMIDGFRTLDHEVDIAGPPYVDLYKTPSQYNEKSGRLLSPGGKVLATFADYAPQIVFELAEVAYNLQVHSSISRALSRKNYDFVYERYSLNCFATSRACRTRNIPLVLEVNDATVIERSRPLILRDIARRYEAEVISSATLIITISNKFRDLLVSEYNLSEKKILVLPNAVDCSNFARNRFIDFGRREAGIPGDKIVVGCVGFFVKWHGLDFLVRSMADVARRHNLFLLFVGDGPVRGEVEELSAKVGIPDLVRFTGVVDPAEVGKYIQHMDICVIPDSNVHGSPMKLFEFMAMAKPVVLPRYQPLLDTLADGNDALFFQPHDCDGLQSAILALAASAALRETLGARGLKILLAHHTWTNHSARVLELLSLQKSADKAAYASPPLAQQVA